MSFPAREASSFPRSNWPQVSNVTTSTVPPIFHKLFPLRFRTDLFVCYFSCELSPHFCMHFDSLSLCHIFCYCFAGERSIETRDSKSERRRNARAAVASTKQKQTQSTEIQLGTQCLGSIRQCCPFSFFSSNLAFFKGNWREEIGKSRK